MSLNSNKLYKISQSEKSLLAKKILMVHPSQQKSHLTDALWAIYDFNEYSLVLIKYQSIWAILWAILMSYFNELFLVKCNFHFPSLVYEQYWVYEWNRLLWAHENLIWRINWLHIQSHVTVTVLEPKLTTAIKPSLKGYINLPVSEL